ncbi:hypothetical protein [Emticicia sp. SJ17W-69]|uniref:hypothetical protein n=1 Tax=Emticicia sp. SJ17W-69 TaxID=3421657 RepID=UPI003EBE90B3
MKTFSKIYLACWIFLSGCKYDVQLPESHKSVSTQTSGQFRLATDESFAKTITLTNYKHWRESDIPTNMSKDSKAACIKAWGCLPTAYLIARRIYEKKWAVDATTYWDLAVSMGTTCKTGTDWTKPGRQAKNDLGNKHRTWEQDAYTIRSDAKNAIKKYLTLDKPIIIAVRINGTADPSIISINKKYNATTKKYDLVGVGHAVVLVGLNLGKDGTGTATYIDPLESESSGKNKKTVNYTTFLDSMNVSATDGGFFMQPIGVFN